jgi:hypothetical protein
MNRKRIGAVIGIVLAGSAGLCSSAAAQRVVGQTLYVSGFEAPTYTLGPLAGQDGWAVSPPLTVESSAMVQGKAFSQGAQAVLFDSGPLGCVMAEWSRPVKHQVLSSAPIITLDWELYLEPSKSPAGWGMGLVDELGRPICTVFVDPGGTIFYALVGGNPISTDTLAERGVWNKFQILLDYGAQTAGIFLNGQPIDFNGDWVNLPGIEPGNWVGSVVMAATAPGRDRVVLDSMRIMASTGACYADCDGSAALNVNDFICFQGAFAEAIELPYEKQVGHYANCDGNAEPPVLTVNDYVCFLTRFAGGCP